MDGSCIIYLIEERKTQDALKHWTVEEIPHPVYCSVQSMSRAEWHEAGRSGLQPALVFTMFCHDYHGEKILEYDCKRYGIYRTYKGTDESVELYTEEKGGIHE